MNVLTKTTSAFSLPRSTFIGALVLGALRPSTGAAQTLPVLRATTAIDDGATPFLYAIQSGLFRTNGLDASIERSANGAAVAAAVLGGSFEVGKASIISFLNAHAHSLPLLAVAAAGDYDASRSNAALVVKSGGPIQVAADLNGKTLAVSALNDLFTLAARTWIDMNGGDSSTIKLVELTMSSAANAIAAGRIDAAVLVEPYLDRDLQAGSVRSLGDPVASLGKHHTDSVWFMTIDGEVWP